MADSKVIIAATITADTDAATKSMLKLKGTIADLRKEFKNAQAGSDEQVAALKKLQAAEAQLGATHEKSQGHFKGMKDSIAGLPGPLGQASQGVSGLGNTFKALLANPIGLAILAIVGAFTLLYNMFTNTFEGGQKVVQIFAGIKAAVGSLFDNLDKIGSAIVKLFSGDFSGFVAEIKGVASAAIEAGKRVADLTRESQLLAREQLKNDLEAAERAKKLAILREQATDEGVDPAVRRKLLKELQADAEQNSRDDIDLAARTAKNKIALLSEGKDAELKNAEEINQIKIEQIRVETDNANELRRIGKQVTAAEKEETAKRKEATAKAREEAKAEREKQFAAESQILKLKQDNELAAIKDTGERSLRQIEINLANEKKANQLAFNDKRLTRAQYDAVNFELEEKAYRQRTNLIEQQNAEAKKKEEAHETSLNKLRTEIRLRGITDGNELERAQMELQANEDLQKAIADYGDDQTALQEAKNLINERLKLDQEEFDRKIKEEDEKKKLESAEGETDLILNDPEAAYEQKKAVLDAELLALIEARDAGILTEQQYTIKYRANKQAQKEVDAEYKDSFIAKLDAIKGAADTFAGIVGKQTVVGKALAVVSATIDTYKAVGLALSTYPPPFSYVAAAASAAAGILNVKKILSVKVPGNADAGGSAPTMSAMPTNAPVAPRAISTTLSPDTIDQINKQGQDPRSAVRAYVLDSDATSEREKQARLERASRLGG